MDRGQELIAEDLGSFKFCPSCKTQKSKADFHSKGVMSNGEKRLEGVCKKCSNEKKKKKRHRKERRKRAKNSTLKLSGFEVSGALDQSTIENFGKAYGNLLKEVMKDEYEYESHKN